MLRTKLPLNLSHRFHPPSYISLRLFHQKMSEAAGTSGSLEEQIAQQTTLMNELRLKKDPGLDAVRSKLAELKKALGVQRKELGLDSGKKKERLLLKTAKVRRAILKHIPSTDSPLGYTRLRPERNVLQRACRTSC